MFTYTIFGLEMFAYTLSFDENNVPVEDPYRNGPDNVIGTPPNENFNTFLDATLSVFIVLANDGWSTIYFNHYRVLGPVAPTLFFVSLLIIGQNILFQLFLAILLQEFDESSLIAEAKNKAD